MKSCPPAPARLCRVLSPPRRNVIKTLPSSCRPRKKARCFLRKRKCAGRCRWPRALMRPTPNPQEERDMDEKELSELTRKTAEMLFGPPKKGEGAYALWRQFNPELAKQFSLFFTGRLYAREVLSQKQRELCAVAALAVRDFQDELRMHCHAALNVGATRDEVAEVIFQMATYGGVPCMVEGLKTLKKVLEERGEWKEEK